MTAWLKATFNEDGKLNRNPPAKLSEMEVGALSTVPLRTDCRSSLPAAVRKSIATVLGRRPVVFIETLNGLIIWCSAPLRETEVTLSVKELASEPSQMRPRRSSRLLKLSSSTMSPTSSSGASRHSASAGPRGDPEKSCFTLAKNWQSPSVSTETKNFPHFASLLHGGMKKKGPHSPFRLPVRSARPSGLKAGGNAVPFGQPSALGTMVPPLLCQLVMVMRGKAPMGMLEWS